MEDISNQNGSLDSPKEAGDDALVINADELSDEEIDVLEAALSENLGADRYKQIIKNSADTAKHIAGTGDIPPGYYDEVKDPMARRRREVSRKMIIGALASAIGLAALGVAAHRFKNRESQPEDKK